MNAVVIYGTPLIDDPGRFGAVLAVGLDETLFARLGPFCQQLWSTQIVDVAAGQLLNIVPGRDRMEPCAWFAARPEAWWAGISWATLDPSASYKAVFDTMLPDAVQVAVPFHVVRVATHRAGRVPAPGAERHRGATAAAATTRSTGPRGC